MNTPPPLSPTAHTRAISEDLLKRSGYAGRNLSVLAVLATLAATGLIAATLFVKGAPGVIGVLAATITLIAAGYWVLTVAARRGNPTAVGIVIVAMVLQICLTLISSGLTAARTNSEFHLPMAGLVVPILVLAALFNSRKTLVELKHQQLWDQIFGAAKPSGTLCLIGAILVGTGFVGMDAGSFYVQAKASQQQTSEIQHAKAFVELIKGDEKDFLTAMQGVFRHRSQSEIDAALAKLATLEQRFDTLKNESAGSDRLLSILTTYGNALRQWKNGLMLLKEPNADPSRVQAMFKLGDKLRAEASQQFDQRYGAKKPTTAAADF